MSDKTVFETEWFSIEKESFTQLSNLDNKPFYRLNIPDGVVVLALTPEKKFILVKQYRPALRDYTLELPSGEIEKGEPLDQAIKRELFEETGYHCNTMTYVGFGRVMSSRSPMKLHAFIGLDAVMTPHFKAKEDIEVLLVDHEEFKSLVLNQQFQQWFGVSLLLIASWKYPHLSI